MENMTNETTIVITENTKSLGQLLEELNCATTKEAISLALTTLETACAAENTSRMNNAVNSFLSMADDRKAMFTEFINNPFVKLVRVKENTKSKEHELATGKKQIPFARLEAAYQTEGGKVLADGKIDADLSKTLAQSKRYHAMLNYFVDNLIRNIAGDLSENTKKVSVPKLTTGNDTQRKEYDFSGNSVNALESQLNAIVDTILPDGMTVKMMRTDVKALKQAATTEKYMQFSMSNEGRILNKIFNAIEIRMNDKAYTLTSKARAHKQNDSAPSEKQSA